MSLSLLLLHLLHYTVPCRSHCPFPFIGAFTWLCLSISSFLIPTQWIRPPNIIVGSGNNGTVSLSCTHGNKAYNGAFSVASCCPGRQSLEQRVSNKYGHPHRVCILTLPAYEVLIVTCILQSHQSQLLFCQTHTCRCSGESQCFSRPSVR